MNAVAATMIVVTTLMAAGPSPVPAQPADGDLVLSVLHNQSWAQGLVVHFDPQNPVIGTMGTNVVPGAFGNEIQMGTDNVGVVVAEIESSFQRGGWLTRVDPQGRGTTLAFMAQRPEGIDLDGDNQWVVAGAPFQNLGNILYGVDDASGAVTTFHRFTPHGSFYNTVTVVREGYTYAVGAFAFQTSFMPKLYGVSRSGIMQRIVQGSGQPLMKLSGVALDPRTGDIITADFDGQFSRPVERNGLEISRVSRSGTVTAIAGFSGANDVVVAKDGTAFVIGHVLRPPARDNAVMHVDLQTHSVKSIYVFPKLNAPPWGFSGVEIYGRRVITVDGAGGPNRTVKISVKSHRIGAAGALYQLAVSRARRPGVRLPTGEYLDLDVTDPLFLLTATNRLGGLTRNFSGKLDANGRAQASITFPAGFPGNVGVTLFVSGVIFNTKGVLQAANTHWFEL